MDDVVRASIASDLELECAACERNGLKAWLRGARDEYSETLRRAHCGRTVISDDDAHRIGGRALRDGGSPVEDAITGIERCAARTVLQTERQCLRGEVCVARGVGEIDRRACDDSSVGDDGERGRGVEQ